MQVIQGLVLFNVFLALCFNSVNAMKRSDEDVENAAQTKMLKTVTTTKADEKAEDVENAAQTKMLRTVTTTKADEKAEDVENAAQNKMLRNVTTTKADEKTEDVENAAQTEMLRTVTTTKADEKDRILDDTTEANSIRRFLWAFKQPAIYVHSLRRARSYFSINPRYLSKKLIQELLKNDEIEEVKTPKLLKTNPNSITGRYSFFFLPLDGILCSQSTAPAGTAFSIYKKVSTEGLAEKEIVAAGYLLYEDTIKLVLAYNNNVHYLLFLPEARWFKYIKTFTGFPLAIKDEEHDCITHPISYFHNILNGEAQSFFLPRRKDKSVDQEKIYLHTPICFIAENFKKSLRRIPDIF